MTDYREAPPFFTVADSPPVAGDAELISPYPTTPRQVEHWAEDGYVVLPEMLSPAQVQVWREVLDQAVAARARRMPLANDPVNSTSSMYTQRCGLRFNCRRFNELVIAASRVVGKVAADLNRHPAGFRLYLDNVLIKEAWADPTKWHVDTVSFAFNSPFTSSFWIPLDPATETNGCLMFVKGSHRALLAAADPYESRPRDASSGIGALFTTYPEFRDLEVAAAPVPAGTAICHNALTAHAAGANMSHGRRRALVLHMMAEGHNQFNGNYDNPFLTVEDRGRIRPGDVLDERWGDAGLQGFTFPLLYAASAQPARL